MTQRPTIRRTEYLGWQVLCWIVIVGWFLVVGLTQMRHLPAGSPDEAANFMFSSTLATTGTLHRAVPLTADENAIFHARSVVPQSTALVPGSFLGFTMWNALWLKIGFYGPYIVASLMAIVAVWSVYRIGRRYWSWPWSMMAAGSAAAFPGYIAFVSLPYHQAGLYTSLLMFTGLMMLRFEEQPSYRRAAVLGLVYGLALFIRPVEVLWTGPIIAVLQVVKPQGWKKLFVTMLAAFIVQLPWLIVGFHVYGSILGSGYTANGLTLTTNTVAGSRSWWTLFVPPGGHWSWQAWSHFMSATIGLFPVISSMAAIALVYYFRRKFVGLNKVLKIGTIILFVAAYILYYGSENIAPNTPARVSFLSSYVRYWLPLFVAMAIGTTVFLRTIIQRWRLVVPMIGLIWLISGWQLWSHESAGLSAQARRDTRFRAIQAQVDELTDPNAFIFSGSLDKVIMFSRNTSYRVPSTPEEWRLVSTLAQQHSVYMFASAWPDTFTDVQQSAGLTGLRVIFVGRVDDSAVWQFIPTS